MSYDAIKLGAYAGDGLGDPLRTAGGKINAMFSELYAASLSLSADQSTLSSEKNLLVRSLEIEKYFNQTGIGVANLALGKDALNVDNFSGSHSTVIGYQANKSATTSENNVAIGSLSLFYNTIGSKNVAIGKEAMYNSITSADTVAIGFQSGISSQGNQNIFIGALSKPLAAADNNSIVLGYGAIGKGPNTVVIGNSSITDNYFFGDLHADNLVVSDINASGVISASGYTDANWNAAYDYSQIGHQVLSDKGQANGYVPLNSGAKIDSSYLPDYVVGQVEYQGTWNAATNTPALSTLTTPKGHYYIVSAAGTFDSVDYAVGDWIISDGTAWNKVDNTDAVTTFNGRLGSIVPISTDYDSFFYTKSLLDAGQLDNRYYTETELNNIFSGVTARSGYNKSNWDTAYGWGNWATGVTKLFVDALNVDADTLDGLNSTAFSLASHNHDDRYYTEAELNNFFSGATARSGYNKSNWDSAYSYSQIGHQVLSEKGQANGYVPLDAGAKISETYLPDSILGQVEYQGTWNAATNTPTLSTLTTPKGHYYIVSDAGTFDSIDYAVGDWIISDGTSWNKVDNTDAVTAFNGRLGNIQPIASDYSSFYLPLGGGSLTGPLIGTSATFSGAISANGYYDSNWNAAYTYSQIGHLPLTGGVLNGGLSIIDTSNPDTTSGSLIVEGRRDGGANVMTLRARDASAPSLGVPDGQGAVLRWQGFNGTGFENMGYIFVGADGQAIANNDAPSFMSFGTSGDGSSSPIERMRIDPEKTLFGYNSGVYTNIQTFAEFGNTVIADQYGIQLSSAGNCLVGAIGSNTRWSNGVFSKNNATRSAGWLEFVNIGTAGKGSIFSFKTALQDNTAELTRFIIDSDGNAGTGTATPLVKSHINGIVYAEGGSWNGGGAEGNRTNVGMVIDKNDFIYTRDGGQYLRPLIGKSGDFIQLGEAGTSLIKGIRYYSGTTCDHNWYNSSAIAMRLTASGLGLGTTTPSGKLHLSTTGDTYLHMTGGAIPKTYAFMVDSNNLRVFEGASENWRFNTGGDFHANGDVLGYSTTISDKRLKDDVETIDSALDKVKSLRGVSYVWNNGSRKGQKDLGVIAQEVEEVLPEIVREKEMPLMDDSGEKYKTIDYEKIVGVLIEAIKELSMEVEQLKSK